MKREIKFRGKCLDTKKWIISLGLLQHSTGRTIMAIKEDTDGFVTSPVDIETIGQFTGLKDKNGKEIYEGDIVKFKEGYIKPQPVYWNNEMTGFYPLISVRAIHLEIIGNIHENPELL